MVDEAPVSTPTLALDARGLSKAFGDNVALRDVDLAIAPGTIHALVGMNGSGKSTLVKILANFYQRDAGQIEVGGRTTDFHHRIAFVHQDLALVESLTVIENLSLGKAVQTRRGRIDRRAEHRAALESLAPFGMEYAARMPVGRLTKAEKTIVAIARALQGNGECSLLVLDEPTSTLPARETARLLDVARRCADSGLGVLFISHRLGEVAQASDEVTVLRNGQVVMHEPTAEVSVARIVAEMGGRQAAPDNKALVPGHRLSVSRDADVVVEARNITYGTLSEVSISVRAGEVLGIAGVLGSGTEELGALLSGRTSPTSGDVLIANEPIVRHRSQVGFVPANRVSQAVLSGLSARENASIAGLAHFKHRGRINLGRERAEMSRWFADMKVHPPRVETDMLSLSGGNQQKVLFARWLSVKPRLLVADEPTQGVDVYAKSDILTKLRDYAANGLAVVLISGEPEEIAAACDRMIVVNHGRVHQEFEAPVNASDVIAEMHKGDIHDDHA